MDQQPAVEEPVVAVAASPEPQPVAGALAFRARSLSTDRPNLRQPSRRSLPSRRVAEPATRRARSPSRVGRAASAEPAPVSLQTIANAYRDYTRKSLEEFGSFVEQLSGVRSLDKAMTVQSEFVKRAYETSVAESQKICELHNRLAKQTLDPFKGLTGKAPATHGKS